MVLQKADQQRGAIGEHPPKAPEPVRVMAAAAGGKAEDQGQPWIRLIRGSNWGHWLDARFIRRSPPIIVVSF